MNLKNFTKKGAVLGIDARVALVVFSILGLVGAYYAQDNISNAQNESFVNQVDTLRQAAMQAYIDNGYSFQIADGSLNNNIFNVYSNSTGDLNRGKNNQAYIQLANNEAAEGYFYITTPERKVKVDSKNIYSSTALAATGASINDCAVTTKVCYYFIKLEDVSDELYSQLEAFYDNKGASLADNTVRINGIVVAPDVDLVNDAATVYVNVGER